MCGNEFKTNANHAEFCPECRKQRQKERSNEYQRKLKNNETVMRIGSTQNCIECGKPFVVHSGSQKVCEDCRELHKRKKQYKTNSAHKKRTYDECSVLLKKDGTKERFSEYAVAKNLSLSALFIEAVEEYMNNHPLNSK